MTANPVIRELVSEGERRLDANGVLNARRNAEWLLCYTLGCTPLYLHVNSLEAPEERKTAEFRERIERRAAREPLQHILGTTEFMSLTLDVTPDVFVPRPETETLVERALSVARSWPLHEPLDVLDLCCGSGAIGVAVAANVANARVHCVDRNPAAVRLTRRNAERCGVGSRVAACVDDAVSFVGRPGSAEWPQGYAIILCNPPYVASAEIEALPPEVRDHDPREALDGGPDGLEFYRRLVPRVGDRLLPGGATIFEIGDGQGGDVARLMERAGFGRVRIERDYATRERIVFGDRGHDISMREMGRG